MSEELGRRLEKLYGGLDPSAGRLQALWRPRARPVAPPSSWRRIGAGSAAVAAGLLLGLWLRRPDPEPSRPRPELARPGGIRSPELSTAGGKGESFLRPPSPAQPAPAAPLPVSAAPEAPGPPPEAPNPEPVSAPEPPESSGEPRKGPSASSVAERPRTTLCEVEGTFDLGDRNLRGRQKDLSVASGDRLRAQTVVRIGLAEDRWLLLAPRSVVEFRPEAKQLTVAIDLGDLHAELVGPGPQIRVATRTCEVEPEGTVFSVRAEEKRTTVIVERGRIEVRGAKGRGSVRAGESVLSTDDGQVSASTPGDFRLVGWTRSHRAPEATLFSEDFSRTGAWQAEVDRGVARAIPASGAAGMIHLESDRPLFEIPVRGQIQIVCRADHASKLTLQFFVREARANFRKELQVLRTPGWKTLLVDLDDCLPFDRSKSQSRAPAGAGVYDLGLWYGEEGEKGNFWVRSIRVVELRP